MSDLNENIQWTTTPPVIVDNRTGNRGYLQPFPDNPTAVDCARIATALGLIDSDVAALSDAQEELQRANIKGAILDVTIPSIGWQTLAGAGIFYVDIFIEGCTENLSPQLSINFESWRVARECGLLTAVETRENALRVFAQAVPVTNMTGKLILLGAGCVIPSSSVVGVGDGMTLSDGVLGLTFATDPDVENIFGGESITPESIVTVSEGMTLTDGVLALDLATKPDVEEIFDESSDENSEREGDDGSGNE